MTREETTKKIKADQQKMEKMHDEETKPGNARDITQKIQPNREEPDSKAIAIREKECATRMAMELAKTTKDPTLAKELEDQLKDKEELQRKEVDLVKRLESRLKEQEELKRQEEQNMALNPRG